jgi:hypothetical protein
MTAAEHQCGDNTCALTRPAPSSSSRLTSKNQRNILHLIAVPAELSISRNEKEITLGKPPCRRKKAARNRPLPNR